MKRLSVLLFSLLLLAPCLARAEKVSYLQGTLFFPDQESAAYRYDYRYPFIEGDSLFAALVNDTFEQAFLEMTELTLPMYASSEAMRGDSLLTVSSLSEITCDNDDYFSVLSRRTQEMPDGTITRTLESFVFASKGEYEGELLTLRGLLMEGESSTQLSELIFSDIWRMIEEEAASGESRFLAGLTREALASCFFPDRDFYADVNGDAVFFFQPGAVTRDALASPEYTYSRQQVRSLLNE